MYGMNQGMNGANMSGIGMSQGMNQGGMVHSKMSGAYYHPTACCPPLVAAPVAPVGVGAGIIAIAILILLALGVIF